MMPSRGDLPRLSAQDEEAIRRRQTGWVLDVKPILTSSSPTWTVPLTEQVRVALRNWYRSV
ncbi:MAG: hypothetical protein K0S98_1040 [Propionibacteriaceae bacterium]|jgi:hypothetical protein|nr:hypothetical protein [Propionibacteriaceae bacterium]